MLAESSARVERIQESYEALQEAKRSFTNDFRQLLKTYTEVMDSMEISSAREIEASLRERLDTESIAVAREAASHETAEHTAPEPYPANSTPSPQRGVVAEAASAEDDAATQRIEPETARATPEEIDSEIAELEATEPEIEPSTSEEPAAQTPTEDPGAQPEPREARAVDELDGPTSPPRKKWTARSRRWPRRGAPRASSTARGRGSSEEGERESRIFRASRFLRRRE